MPGSPFKCALLCCLFACFAACSTPISPYSQLDNEVDEEDDDDFDPSPTATDAGRARDAGVSPVARDAGGVSRDAGPPVVRDAGTPRDAGSVSATTNCMRLPTDNFASLLLDGCSARPTISCSEANRTPQEVINQYLALLAAKCGSPAGASIGVVFGNDGCPTQLRYVGMGVAGSISNCLQSILDNTRIGCSLTCALIGPAAR